MTILANINNLSLRLGHRQIFNQAQLTINAGEKIGVLGLNGHGKSTLFKILLEMMVPDKTQPAFIFDKNAQLSFFHVPQQLEVTEGHLSAQDYFFTFYPDLQKIKSELDAVNEQMIHDYENEKLINKQQRLYEKWEHSQIDRVQTQFLSYLKTFSFTQFDTPVEKLSGGEKRKIALALGLSARESIILWDEPTNHLDLETIEIFEDELHKSQKTFLLISHDRALLSQTCSRIIHITQQMIESFQGTYADYLIHLQEVEAHRLKQQDKIENRLRRETAWMRQGIKARGTRSKKRVEGFHNLQKNLQKLKDLKSKKMSLSFEQDKVKSKRLIEAQNFSLEVPGKKLIDNSDFVITNTSKIAFLGNNGTGKSTLVKAMLDQVSFTGVLKKRDGLKITYFSQHMDIPSEDITPMEYVGEGRQTVTLPSGRDLHIYSYLDDFLFSSEEAKRPLSHFSGGEKKRLQLAKFLLQPSELMVFDEPSNDLDLESIGILETELSSFNGPIILITHDRELIRNSTNTCWHLENQKLDIFQAGFEQWEQEQEIKKLEQQLKAEEDKQRGNQAIDSTDQLKKKAKKLSNKEKMRLKELPSLIEETEMQVLEFEESVESFDYNSGDYQQLEEITQKLGVCNNLLQQLYEEKEQFSKNGHDIS